MKLVRVDFVINISFQFFQGKALNFTNSSPLTNICNYSVIDELEAIIRSPCVRIDDIFYWKILELIIKDDTRLLLDTDGYPP